MPIIGNPWAQDAAAFGQQTGQALSQGLMQLPQQRYAMALQAANLQRALQQQQMMNQYHQGQLGIRQQQVDTQQQGLDMRNQNDQMANQIRLLMAQVAQGNLQNRQNAPLVVPAGSSIYDRNSLGGQQPQPQGQDFGPFGDQQPQGLGQGVPQGPVTPLATAPRQPAALGQGITLNQGLGDQLKALQFGGQLASVGAGGGITNFANQNYSDVTNLISRLNQLNQGRFGPQQQMPTNNPVQGQFTTNALMGNPQNPQQTSTNRIGRFLVQPYQ